MHPEIKGARKCRHFDTLLFSFRTFLLKANLKKVDVYFGVLFNSNYEFDQVGISFIYMYILIFYMYILIFFLT